jgi:prevent-host-death family protein
MPPKYSIAEARQNLAAIVHELEESEQIELTRRGEPVAVLLSMRAYRRLSALQTGFWVAYQAFRQSFPLAELDIQPDVFDDVRDRSLGREVRW